MINLVRLGAYAALVSEDAGTLPPPPEPLIAEIILPALAIAEVLHLKLDGQPVTDPALIRPLLERELDQSLNWLARAGTLVG